MTGEREWLASKERAVLCLQLSYHCNVVGCTGWARAKRASAASPATISEKSVSRASQSD